MVIYGHYDYPLQVGSLLAGRTLRANGFIRWIWLNRGDGSAHVKTNIVKDVRFEDERIVEEERLTRMALEEGVGARRKKARLDA